MFMLWAFRPFPAFYFAESQAHCISPDLAHNLSPKFQGWWWTDLHRAVITKIPCAWSAIVIVLELPLGTLSVWSEWSPLSVVSMRAKHVVAKELASPLLLKRFRPADVGDRRCFSTVVCRIAGI